MKHASSKTVEELEPLLVQLRAIEGLVERKPGVFYLRSKAFLHFHEDPAGVCADLRQDGVEFQRFPVPSHRFAAFARRVAAAVRQLSRRP